VASYWNRINTVLLLLVLVVVIGALASRAFGGPLDPAGPPASTMHTLDDTAPVWDQTLSSTNGALGPIPPAGCNSDRFKCVMSYQQCGNFCITIWPAVLDRETGLVWQRVPDTGLPRDWHFAMQNCANATTGLRDGWRLPTMAELSSLRDESVTTDPQLPVGSPFAMTLINSSWWTSTEDLDDPTYAHYVEFTPQLVSGSFTKITQYNFWCVRGPTSNR
jgi:hypothetical protein